MRSRIFPSECELLRFPGTHASCNSLLLIARIKVQSLWKPNPTADSCYVSLTVQLHSHSLSSITSAQIWQQALSASCPMLHWDIAHLHVVFVGPKPAIHSWPSQEKIDQLATFLRDAGVRRGSHHCLCFSHLDCRQAFDFKLTERPVYMQLVL